MRRTVAGLVALLSLLTAAGCGGDGGGDVSQPPARRGTIDDISVTGGVGSEPRIDFKAPLAFDKTQGKILDKGPGAGDQVTRLSTVTVNYTGVNASDGTTFDSTWPAGEPATFQLDQVIKGFATGLQGAHAGDRAVLAITSQDGYDPVGNGSSISKGDSLVFVVDVAKVTNPKPISQADLPTIEMKDGEPSKFVASDSTPADVGLLGSYVLTEGKGRAVTAADTLTVNYLGQVYPDGPVFDESYSKKKPVSFPLSGVIEGWKQGLLGQKTGSRVILTIPSELGYGSAGQGAKIPPDSDLIFVIDILKAKAS
ncbi:MAG: FKBP-type peptidyl-prolyl cis-trans isomerase [Nocardioidaceae bacterium]|nr:FKBP-type peptidyl-prolyl cis-trans isomerase [Nocardioidaceae bacterium]